MNSMTPEAAAKHLASENRALPKDMVIEYLTDACPHVLTLTKHVGEWLWIMFPSKPDAQTRATLKELGFRFSKRRAAWMHPCGHFVNRQARNYDPRDKYGVEDVNAGE